MRDNHTWWTRSVVGNCVINVFTLDFHQIFFSANKLMYYWEIHKMINSVFFVQFKGRFYPFIHL
jgi:hypothetical protein